jgi:hypothetical protein
MEAWEHISIGSFEAEAPRTTFFVVLLAGAGLGASLLPWKLSALIDCLFWSQVEAYTIKPPGKPLKTIARNGWELAVALSCYRASGISSRSRERNDFVPF